MSKFSLGESSSKVNVDKDNLFINESKTKKIEKDIEKQLEIIRLSLLNINSLLNKSVNQKYIKGTRIDAYKGWARKAKTQATAAEKLKTNVSELYHSDLQAYPIKLLDDRIERLEKKIQVLIKEK